MKKVLVIGATGLLGSHVVKALEGTADVVQASFSGAGLKVDISKPESLKSLLAEVGKVAAIVSTAGMANFVPWAEAKDEDWAFGLANKLMGQINILRYGSEYVNEGGAIVLTTGVLAQYPIPGSAIVSTVNAGVEAAIKATAVELDGKVRIGAVSPGWIAETMEAMGMDPTPGLPAKDVAKHFEEFIENGSHGDILVAAKG